jgi:autotransporter-associated beta strand protein
MLRSTLISLKKMFRKCSGGPRCHRPALEQLETRDVPSTLLGSLALGNQPLSAIAVNPNTDRVYVARGFSSSPLLVVNASDPAHPAIVTTIGNSGSGVTVNPATNRFYSANLGGGQVVAYDGTTNAQLATIGIGYLPGNLDVNPATNLIYVGCQGGALNDPVFVINGATNAVVAGPLGSGYVMSQVHVNPATGNIYANRNTGTRVWNPNYTFLTDLNNIGMLAANPVTNRLYFATGSTGLQVRDGTTHALLDTIPIATPNAFGSAAVNTIRNRLYVADEAGIVEVIDAQADTVLESFSLGPNTVPQAVCVDAGKDRFYVVGTGPGGSSTLYIYQDSDVWTGQGPDNNWSDGANWQGGTAPGPGEDLFFPSGASQLANQNDLPNGTAFSSIRFTGAGYDISGNAITLTSGMTANLTGGGTDTVEDNISLTANTTFTVNPNTTLILSGNLDGNGGLQLTGGGTLTLAGTDTYAGNTTINQGKLLLAGFLDAMSTLTVNAATLELSGTLNVEAGLTAFSGARVTVDEGATLDVFSPVYITSLATLTDYSAGNGSKAGVQVETTRALNVYGVMDVLGDGTLDDFGLVSLPGGFLTDSSSGMGSTAGVQVEPGAELDISSVVEIGVLLVNDSGTVDDFGSITLASRWSYIDDYSNGISGVAGVQVEPGAILANQGPADSCRIAGTSGGNANMVVNGLMSGPLTVDSGGFLEGTGSVGSVTASNGGTIVPGLLGSTGILYAQSVNLTNGGVLYIQIAGYQTPGTDFSKLDTANLVLGGTSKLTLDLSGLTTAGTVRGIVSDAGQTGTFGQVQIVNNPFSFDDTVTYRNDNIDVTIF